MLSCHNCLTLVVKPNGGSCTIFFIVLQFFGSFLYCVLYTFIVLFAFYDALFTVLPYLSFIFR